jgi:hypothetical protein
MSLFTEAVKAIQDDIQARFDLKVRIEIKAQEADNGGFISPDIARYVTDKIARELGGKMEDKASADWELAWSEVEAKRVEFVIYHHPEAIKEAV